MSDYPLVPYQKGEVGPVAGRDPSWVYGREELIEGEFREIPSGVPPIFINIPGAPPDEEPVPSWFGSGSIDEDEDEDGTQGAGAQAPRDPLSSEAREELRRRLEADRELEELAGRVTRAELEAKLREYRQKFKKPSKFERFLKGTGRTWKGVKEAAGPKTPIKGFYIPKAMPEYYVPGGRVRKLTDPTGAPAGYMHIPHLHSLQRAGAPPPTQAIKAPFRDVERFEGLGSALGRLRGLERFPRVDQAVYAEIHANGDIDTPSNVRRKVSQLGFSRSEIDTALKRLREAGFITSSGRKHEGETELMIVGGG